MMPSELSPQARALLDAAREGLGPDAAMLARVRGKIDAAIAGGGSGATVSTGISVGAKLSILSLIALVIGGAMLLRGGDDDAMTSPALELAAPSAVDVPSRHAQYEPPPAAPHIEMAVETAPRPAAASPTPPSTISAQAAPVIEVAPPGVDLAREVQLVDAAMASLRDGNPAAAIQSVRLHRAETNDHGQLAEDAAAIEIEALCKLHDRKVVAKLEAFDARWPDSAQRSRLSTNCF